MNDKTLKRCPCENCDLRKGFAKAFDMHFWGEGCPYKCKEYDDWKCRTGEVTMNNVLKPCPFCGGKAEDGKHE